MSPGQGLQAKAVGRHERSSHGGRRNHGGRRGNHRAARLPVGDENAVRKGRMTET